MDDLATRRVEVKQAEAFYQYRDRLRAVARYAAADFVETLPAESTLAQIKSALQRAQTLLADPARLAQFIANEVSLLNELLEPAEAAIESYRVRYMQAFDQVTAHTEHIRQQIEALRDSPAYLALTGLAQVPALGTDPGPALEQSWTQTVQGPPELFPTNLTHAAVERDLRLMPQPPGCPLALANADDWLQRADDALNRSQAVLHAALRDKATLLHSPTLRDRLAQGQYEPFIGGLLAASSVDELATYLEQSLGQSPIPSSPISLLNRYLKKIQVRKLRLADFAPGKRTFEPGDLEQIVAEFRSFLQQALAAGEDELPVIELE